MDCTSSKYVVVIGGCNLDIAGFSAQPIVARDSNPGEVRFSAGGVGRNIAANLVKLAIGTRLLFAVGDDLWGQNILRECTTCGIDTALVKIAPNQRSSVYFSLHDPSGDMVVALSDMQIMAEVDIAYIKQHHRLIADAAAIVVDTNLDRQVLDYLARTYPRRLSVDTVSTAKAAKIKPLLGALYTLKPNRLEAESLLGFEIASEADGRKAVTCFLHKGVSRVAISLGADGVVYGSGSEIGKISLPHVSAVNTTGAGDAFMAGLVFGDLAAFDIHESVKLALSAAYLTMQTPQTLNPALSLDLIHQTRRKLNL